MPATPREGRITVGIERFLVRTRIQKQLNDGFAGECCCSMQRRLALRPSVAHESTGLYSDLGVDVYFRTIAQQNPHDPFMTGALLR